MALTFTEREHKLMAMAWQCFAEQPKIDIPKLAGLVGMTNEGSARNAWASIRKKLAELTAATGSGDVTTSVSPRKRGRKQVAQSEIGDEAEEEESPSKKSKGRSGNAKNSQAEASKRAESMDSGIAVKVEHDLGFDV